MGLVASKDFRAKALLSRDHAVAIKVVSNSKAEPSPKSEDTKYQRDTHAG